MNPKLISVFLYHVKFLNYKIFVFLKNVKDAVFNRYVVVLLKFANIKILILNINININLYLIFAL